MNITLGLVADDLTGANDSAVQFARRGWRALLTLEAAKGGLLETDRTIPGVRGHSVLAVTTDARALNNSDAEKLTAAATKMLMDSGISRVFLKIDSTMRGSVAGQITGALAAWRTRHANAVAVVCPAYPQMGRTVASNQLLVGGRPVHESAIGRDPVTPVTTSDLSALIPGSTHITPDQLAQNLAPVVTVDAVSEADLARVASAIAAAGPSAIPVGSAGLAEAVAMTAGKVHDRTSADVPRRRTTGVPNPRILIQVTSLNPVSRNQADRLREAFPEVVILLAPAERVGNSSAAEQLAAEFSDRVHKEQWDVLGLIGGDGARAALRRLGASAIQIVDTVLEGIPFGVVVGGRADGVAVFTKAGGFGAEDALVRVVQQLTK
jgi:D-threonate/D-erythronate kinase